MIEAKIVEFDTVMNEYKTYIKEWVKEQAFDLIDVQLDIRGEEKGDGLVDIHIRIKNYGNRMDIEEALHYQAKLTSEIYQATERIKTFKYIGFEAEA